ncbi:C40 family peptidase [Cytobacillus massiliigabonensis]|uniref:C40 family peptidase n=1 Tax=Cytobacillus massiliigabonensis TaxID=1871011 RepID=UPI000C85AE93|nr:C40 family peptidase [Cytobacillus massiliigabonensis]
MFKRLCLTFIAGVSILAFHQPKIEASAAINYNHILPLSKLYIGSPYQFGGTSPVGFDCSGYIQFVFKKMGVQLPRTTADQYHFGKDIDRAQLRVGDIVFFETYKDGPSHDGIYLGDNQFIHASTSKGVMFSSLDDPYYWKERYIGAKRVLDYQMPLGQFKDIPSSFWAESQIADLNKQEIIIGYEGSQFKPDLRITRGEVAALLAEAFELPVADRSKKFNDVTEDHWALGAINAVDKAGIIKGDEAGNFRPEETLSREHLAIIFSRAFELAPAQSAVSFTDIPQGYYAADDIQKLAASGITTGKEDGSFAPKELVNRTQFAVFLSRGIDNK